MASTLRFDNWEDSNGNPILDGTNLSLPSSAMPTGSILQVVSVTDSTDRTTTSTSYADVTGMSISITPSSVSNKIMLIASIQSEISWTSGTTDFNRHELQITDSSNVAIEGAELFKFGTGRFNTTSSASNNSLITGIGYDSPATTSSVTYKLRHRTSNANASCKLQNSQKTGQLFAIEVAG